MKTTVVHHSADFDGVFCREIARKFIHDAELIGWDFADKPLDEELLSQPLIIMDLPVDRPFGLEFKDGWICKGGEQKQPIDRWDASKIIWIDHHASSISNHPANIPGYRIDGVAACRLAWQWLISLGKISQRPCPFCGFMAHAAKTACEQGKSCPHCGGIHWGSSFCPYTEDDMRSSVLPSKQDFIDRKVKEPTAVRLAGEYDIWDKRDPDAELFQHGLRSQELLNGDWEWLLTMNLGSGQVVERLLNHGKAVQYAQRKQDEFIAKNRSFDVEFEGLKFMAINAVRCNSLTFEAATRPDHDALLGFYWDGKQWNVSMYHAPHRKDLDLSVIAVRYGGGGHRGACGFTTPSLPFVK